MNEHNENLQIAGFAGGAAPAGGNPPLVDGVDVAQLLRDIGEASAQVSSVELFRLCLSAQRVLEQVLTDRAAA